MASSLAPGSTALSFFGAESHIMAKTAMKAADEEIAAPEAQAEVAAASLAAAPLAAPIPQGAMQDVSCTRNHWRVVFDAERTPYHAVLTDVAVWGPNEAKLRAGDLIELLDEQSTVFALLYLVEHVPAKFIRFAELIKAPLGGVAVGKVEARGHHYSQWRGPAKCWCVIGPNGTMVREGILTKEEAERDVSTRNTPTSMAFVTHPRM